MHTKNHKMDTDSKINPDVKAELRQQCDQLLEQVETMLAYLHQGNVPADYPQNTNPLPPKGP